MLSICFTTVSWAVGFLDLGIAPIVAVSFLVQHIGAQYSCILGFAVHMIATLGLWATTFDKLFIENKPHLLWVIYFISGNIWDTCTDAK